MSESFQIKSQDGRLNVVTWVNGPPWLSIRIMDGYPDLAKPDDIRAEGWAVAVHNDYKLAGVPHTFWLFTKGNVCVKGEGKTDSEALDAVRKQIANSVTLVVAALAGFTPEQRKDVFREFCTHCGSDDPRCRCWDDS